MRFLVAVMIGSAGKTQTRTVFDMALLVGIPSSRWGARPFVVHPTLYPSSHIEDLISNDSTRHGTVKELRHPIHIAPDWQRDLAANKDLTMARIARNRGISRARVSQIMSFLRLPEIIQKELATLTGADDIRTFSERRRRALLTLSSASDQVKTFQKIRADFRNRCTK